LIGPCSFHQHPSEVTVGMPDFPLKVAALG
jgi:hypothetical protein